ncbi:MAG: hypothetical protein HY905_14460 [Deltaproteobacteria bacterium]|nr:hypothetical protein [Deltaproteobacteria bacterium]
MPRRERALPGDTSLVALVGAIYDAALEPDVWPALIARLSTSLGGRAACGMRGRRQDR